MKSKDSKKNVKQSHKDSRKITTKNRPSHGFVSTWHTDIRRKLKVGSRLILETICGKYEFTVVSMTKISASVESGLIQARLKRVGNVWRYNHRTWSKDTIVTGIVV